MADKFQVEIHGVFSDNSDYSDPGTEFLPEPYEAQPDEFIQMVVEGEVSIGTDIDTSIFESISMLIVKNMETTAGRVGQVTIANATHTNPGAGSGFVSRIDPGGIFVTTDITPAGKVNVGRQFGESDSTVMFEVIIIGS
tara:strand:+ start:54 stop:470 length:417 start_codon:yes stop_codon:yes gene_type:complete